MTASVFSASEKLGGRSRQEEVLLHRGREVDVLDPRPGAHGSPKPGIAKTRKGVSEAVGVVVASPLRRRSVPQDRRLQESSVGAQSQKHVCRVPPAYLKMFTARAVTSRMLTAEIADSDSISSFAHRLSGIESVGLNAIEFVNETYT